MSDFLLGVFLLSAGLFLYVVLRKQIHAVAVNERVKDILSQNSGVKVVAGVGGNQTGSVRKDKRASAESIRNL